MRIWARLESKVRTSAINRGEVYVFTGPIYQDADKQTIGTNRVAVPTHLYKIIYDPNAAEAIAFIMPNEPLDTADMPKYIVTIRDVDDEPFKIFLNFGHQGSLLFLVNQISNY